MVAPRILFIASNRLGDAVLSLGVLAHLVDTRSDARFTVVCGPLAAPLFRAVPRLERLIVAQKRPFGGHWLSVFAQLAGKRWDTLVDMRNVAIFRLLPARRAYRWSRSHAVIHKVEENARVIGVDPPIDPRIWIDKDAEAAAHKGLPQDRRILFLGATSASPQKVWPEERFAELVRRLTSPQGPFAGAMIAIVGAAEERAFVGNLLASLPPEQRIDLVGKLDVLALGACFARADLFIGNDSGLTHLAAAAGAPTLALFGSGAPAIYRPWGARAAYVEHRLPKAEFERIAHGPMDERQKLMSAITVDEVEAAAKALLARVQNLHKPPPG